MKFIDSETRLRRMLRDPDANIWDQDQLMRYFNAAQKEIQMKTGFLARVESYHYPPRYDHAYIFDWEYEYLEGALYQCFTPDQNEEGTVCTYPWETAYYFDSLTASDGGYWCSQPWELACSSTPAERVAIPINVQHMQTLFAAWDQEQIEPISERRIAEHDPWYKTHSGAPKYYYFLDEIDRRVALWPMPSGITWDDSPEEGDALSEAGLGLDTDGYDSAYVFDWEYDDGYTTGPGILKVTRTYGDYEVTYGWEEGIEEPGGMVLDLGLLGIDVAGEEGTGIVIDTVQSEDTLLMAYKPVPEDIQEWSDSSAFSDPFVKYVEYGTLERAYGADTDGFIPTLRDYWKMRKEVGINAIKRFMSKRVAIRKFQMGGLPKAKIRRGPRLPDTFPDFY